MDFKDKYDWADVSIFISGVKMKGIKPISYTVPAYTSGNVYDGASTYEGTITIRFGGFSTGEKIKRIHGMPVLYKLPYRRIKA